VVAAPASQAFHLLVKRHRPVKLRVQLQRTAQAGVKSGQFLTGRLILFGQFQCPAEVTCRFAIGELGGRVPAGTIEEQSRPFVIASLPIVIGDTTGNRSQISNLFDFQGLGHALVQVAPLHGTKLTIGYLADEIVAEVVSPQFAFSNDTPSP